MLDLSKINTDTGVRLLTNKMAGSTELNNSWGSLGSVLKATLYEGFNEKIMKNLSLDAETKLITVTLDLGHGYSYNQVVRLSGIDPSLDGDYRIVDLIFNSIVIYYKGDSSQIPVKLFEDPLDESCKIKVSPLGYDLLYDDFNLSGQLVFKNKCEKSPAVLKIIDAIPPNAYTTTWAKFARIVVGRDMVDINNFTNNEKVPFVPDFPNPELTGNGVKGSAGIHGFAKWYYSAVKGHTFTETGVPNRIYPTDWRIIGDDKTFYLFVKTQGLDYSWFNLYSFGNSVSNREQDSDNIILHASFRWKTASASTGSYTYSSGDNTFTKMSSSESCCLFKSSLGSYTQNFLGSHFGLDSGGTAAERDYPSLNTKNISGISSNTGQFLLSPLYIKDSTLEYRGQLRGITQFYGVGQIKELTYFDGDSVVLSAEGYYNSSNYSDNNKIPYLFSFKDWEYV